MRWAVWIVAFVIVLARQPHNLLRPQWAYEEVAAFWVPTFFLEPLEYLLEPWAGYLQVPARLAFLFAKSAPSTQAPIVTTVFAAVVIASVATFFTSNRLCLAIPDVRVRVGFAFVIPLLPVSGAFVGPLNAHWFLALYLVGLSLTIKKRWWDYPAVAFAGLSGVAAILTLPLFWRDKRGLVLAACAGIQFAVLINADRTPNDFALSRVAILALVMLLLVALIPALPVRTRLSFLYLGAVVVLAGSWSRSIQFGSRYLLPLVAGFALMVLAGAIQRRFEALLPAALLLALIFGSLGLPDLGDTDWQSNADCIGGAEPCEVPVRPADWSVSWPGAGGVFVHPHPWMARSESWGRFEAFSG